MHQVKAKKVEYHGYKFDSVKECQFFANYIEPGNFNFECHPRFEIFPTVEVNGYKFRQAAYTPDFVVYDKGGDILHVYDVKNSFGAYGIDAAAKLRFKAFTAKYKHPVEAVVMRKNYFKVKVLGTTKRQEEHAMQTINYHVWELMK